MFYRIDILKLIYFSDSHNLKKRISHVWGYIILFFNLFKHNSITFFLLSLYKKEGILHRDTFFLTIDNIKSNSLNSFYFAFKNSISVNCIVLPEPVSHLSYVIFKYRYLNGVERERVLVLLSTSSKPAFISTQSLPLFVSLP